MTYKAELQSHCREAVYRQLLAPGAYEGQRHCMGEPTCRHTSGCILSGCVGVDGCIVEVAPYQISGI